MPIAEQLSLALERDVDLMVAQMRLVLQIDDHAEEVVRGILRAGLAAAHLRAGMAAADEMLNGLIKTVRSQTMGAGAAG